MREYLSSTINLRSISLCAVMLLVNCVFAAAQHEQVLYSFGTNSGDGTYPAGTLIADAAGNLYGTVEQGGSGNAGIVFELSPTQNAPWTETILYAFSGGQDGGGPNGTLVFDSVGNLYGTTSGDGDPICQCGTVFELSPPSVQGGSWSLTTLYSFTGGNDGDHPEAGVVFDPVGNLYGTTSYGGGIGSCVSFALGCGAVFELSPPSAPGGAWTEAVLYSFTGGDDGGIPVAPVVLDRTGNVYGTTGVGGTVSCELSNCGTIFELTPSGTGAWKETVIHDFGSIHGDGYSPTFAGLFLDKSGALVGTTPGGGSYGFGTVFGLLPPSSPGGKWTYGVLYSFGKSQTDGSEPQGGVIAVNGMLYGTTIEGGTSVAGTVFQLARSKGEMIWKETGLYSFRGDPDGRNPMAGLILHGGGLYGTTHQGGSTDSGTVFRIFK